jgi:hypothetical protein
MALAAFSPFADGGVGVNATFTRADCEKLERGA